MVGEAKNVTKGVFARIADSITNTIQAGKLGVRKVTTSITGAIYAVGSGIASIPTRISKASQRARITLSDAWNKTNKYSETYKKACANVKTLKQMNAVQATIVEKVNTAKAGVEQLVTECDNLKKAIKEGKEQVKAIKDQEEEHRVRTVNLNAAIKTNGEKIEQLKFEAGAIYSWVMGPSQEVTDLETVNRELDIQKGQAADAHWQTMDKRITANNAVIEKEKKLGKLQDDVVNKMGEEARAKVELDNHAPVLAKAKADVANSPFIVTEAEAEKV